MTENEIWWGEWHVTGSGMEVRRRPDGGGAESRIQHSQRRRCGAPVNVSDGGDARYIGHFDQHIERKAQRCRANDHVFAHLAPLLTPSPRRYRRLVRIAVKEPFHRLFVQSAIKSSCTNDQFKLLLRLESYQLVIDVPAECGNWIGRCRGAVERHAFTGVVILLDVNDDGTLLRQI